TSRPGCAAGSRRRPSGRRTCGWMWMSIRRAFCDFGRRTNAGGLDYALYKRRRGYDVYRRLTEDFAPRSDFRSPGSLRLLGGVIIHVAPIGHAFVEVVPFGPPCSFCATCCWITRHPRRKRLGGESLTLLCELGGNG